MGKFIVKWLGKMKESILVIGASGFLGYQIKTFLEAKGNKVFGTYSKNYVEDLFKFSYNQEKSIDQFKSEVLDKIYNQGYYINSVVIASGITNDQSILNSDILDFREVFSNNLEYPFFISKIMIEYCQ